MFDALSFAEIDGQHAELLPARTVLSLFSTGGGGGVSNSASACNDGASGLVGVSALNGVLQNGLIPILSPSCNATASVG